LPVSIKSGDDYCEHRQSRKKFLDIGTINPQRLSAVDCGDAKALPPSSSPTHRAENRRVDTVYTTEDEK
jgi:flagellar motor protein MotB